MASPITSALHLNETTSITEPARVSCWSVWTSGATRISTTALMSWPCWPATAGDLAVARVIARRKAPDAALFVGSGKAEELKALVLGEQRRSGAVSTRRSRPFSSAIWSNLLGVPVSDRTALILEIFAQRARSHEGKLQVELAQLQYLATRLVRRWSHLERQRGGIGTRGGPGERQMELDRRMIDERIKQLKIRLHKCGASTQYAAQGAGSWRPVARVAWWATPTPASPPCSMRLTKAGSYAADQLFATLDTTTRALYLGADGNSGALLSDTVGFIRDLPHKSGAKPSRPRCKRLPMPICCCM